MAVPTYGGQSPPSLVHLGKELWLGARARGLAEPQFVEALGSKPPLWAQLWTSYSQGPSGSHLQGANICVTVPPHWS